VVKYQVMKVFLLNEINKYDSVGINLLSAILKAQGHQSRVFLIPDLISNTTISMNFLKMAKFAFYISDEKYVDYLLAQKPDVIAFSAVTSYWMRSSHLAKIIKRKNPNVIIVAGGPHTTISIEKEMFESGGIDYICKGDGEIAFPKLIDALETKNHEPDIKGIYYLRQNEIQGHSMGEVVYDLDSLPFQDKSDVYYDYPYLSKLYCINTQRSCQFSCTYCGSPNHRTEYAKVNEKIFRRRSVDSVVKEIYEAKKRYPSINKVGFFDDTFTTGKEWVRDFAREYKKYVRLPFFMCTNPCLLQDENLVMRLKESGLVYVEIGVQAIDEEFRMKKIKRPDSDKQIFESARLLRKYNVYIQTNHIFGLDERDFYDEGFLKETVEYYIRLNPNRTHCFELEYLPGSLETERALENHKLDQKEYEKLKSGETSVSYNFGGSIHEKKKAFIVYIVLLEMMPFLPNSVVRIILHNKFLFGIIRLVPFNYIILARLLNTIKDRRDIEGSPHYGKYIDGAKYILWLKKQLDKQ